MRENGWRGIAVSKIHPSSHVMASWRLLVRSWLLGLLSRKDVWHIWRCPATHHSRTHILYCNQAEIACIAWWNISLTICLHFSCIHVTQVTSIIHSLNTNQKLMLSNYWQKCVKPSTVYCRAEVWVWDTEAKPLLDWDTEVKPLLDWVCDITHTQISPQHRYNPLPLIWAGPCRGSALHEGSHSAFRMFHV